jgi:putative peptidoglycan lipid II flippase
MLTGACLLGGSVAVNNSMAATLGAGSVAALTYGTKVVTVILAIGSAAIATVALPHFSRLAARFEWRLISETTKTFQRLILLVTVPLTGAVAYASEPLVRTLYQRGSFTEADVLLVGKVQSLYILQLPFMMLSALVYRLISSLRSNEVLMWGAALHLMSTVALNYVCIQRLGIAGIALGSSIAAAIYYWSLVCSLTRLLKTNTLYRVAETEGFVST